MVARYILGGLIGTCGTNHLSKKPHAPTVLFMISLFGTYFFVAHNACIIILRRKRPLAGPKVKFLREKLAKLGCEMPSTSFVCQPCEGMDISGGFVPPVKDAKGNYAAAEVRHPLPHWLETTI